MDILILDKSIEGGTGSFILNLLKITKVLKKIKITVLVLEEPSLRSVDALKFKYFRPKNFYPKHYSPTISNLISLFEEFIWLKDNIIQIRPDIIISVDLRSNVLAILNKILLFRNIKVIATVQIVGSVFDKSILNFLIKKIVMFLYNQADELVCCSKLLAKSIKSDFSLHKTPITIYPGADFKEINTKNFNKSKNKIVISVARLSDQKDHLNLLEAFKILKQELPFTKLWLLSDGPKRLELENFVNKNNLTDCVNFFGWVSDIRLYLRKSDIFVLSSKKEGFAYVLIEAMSCGLPVISTDTPHGPREVLENGKYGILAPMNNPGRLEKSMYKLLTNKSQYNELSIKSIRRSKDFSVDKMLKGYANIIAKFYDIKLNI